MKAYRSAAIVVMLGASLCGCPMRLWLPDDSDKAPTPMTGRRAELYFEGSAGDLPGTMTARNMKASPPRQITNSVDARSNASACASRMWDAAIRAGLTAQVAGPVVRVRDGQDHNFSTTYACKMTFQAFND